MTAPKNGDRGTLPRAALLAALPDPLPIRKGKNGKLYIVGPWGAWYMNTPAGQDLLLERGTFYTPDNPGPAPEPTPATPAAPPAAPPAPSPPEPQAEPPQKRGILSWLGDLD